MICLLIANCNLTWQIGCTPCYIAAANGHVEITKLLLAQGANIESETNVKLSFKLLLSKR
jgi:ankyrin repeat protein